MSKVQGRQLDEEDLRQWMTELGIEANLNSEEEEEIDFRKWLRDGVVLCQLINCIRPGSVEEVRRFGWDLVPAVYYLV